VRAGKLADASKALADVPADHALHAAAERLQAGLAVIDAPVDPGESRAAAEFAGGRDALRAGRLDAAAEAFLRSVAADKSWRDGVARRALVALFEVLDGDGGAEDSIRAWRGRLATLLY
jgi:thioredoxin-like negative regulator of GroEL